MLKILHVIQGCGGGVASLIGNLIRSTDKVAVVQDVLSFSYENGETFVEELKKNGSKMFLLPRPRKEGYGTFRKYMLKVLKEGCYDVVHCHTDGWRAILYRSIAREAKVPLFCIHAHRASNDPGFLGQNRLFIRLNQAISRKNADIKFACGTEAAKFIYGDVDDFVTIPNGINLRRCEDATKVDKLALKASLGIEADRIVILQVGRLVTQKNHDFTVQIARELKNRDVAFKLLIAGTGDLEQSIRQKLEDQALTDYVDLLGRRNDIYELMAMADVMILPSLYEGLPTVAIEAQAMGLYSLLADTVTAECDLGLGLIRRLPIANGADCWAEAIVAGRETEKPQREQIRQVLEANAYTAEASVRHYLTTLLKKIAER